MTNCTLPLTTDDKTAVEDEEDVFMHLCCSEMLGIPNPLSYYTLELIPDEPGAEQYGRRAFYFVINPEQLPILKTAKALRLLAKYQVHVGGIIVNHILPKEADGAFLADRRGRKPPILKRSKDSFRV